MIATATINGIAIEIKGTPEECYRFFSASRHHKRFDNEERHPFFDRLKIKACDPFARHYGNCGAKDCPIMPRNET